MFNLNRSTDFRSSFIQFGHSAADLVATTAKLPFSGGWGRLVLFGPPVLLLYGGVAYLVSKLAIRLLSSAAHYLYAITKSLYNRIKTRFSPKKPVPAPPSTNSKPSSQPVSIPPIFAAAKPSVPIVHPPQVVYQPKPLPADAAKDRNQSLLKFSAVVEEFVIDPLVKKKDLIAGINCSEKELKTWLISMTLWSLGKAWDELEGQYVKFNTSPVDTLESVQKQASFIDPDIGKFFEQNKLLTDYEAILKGINGSNLSDKNKLALVALYYKYEAIIKGAKNPKNSATEEDEIKQKFAKAMNHGMATTLTHMIDIVQGWLTLVDKPSVALIPVFPASAQAPIAAAPDKHSLLVDEVSIQLKENLTNKYLVPIWIKKYQEWKKDVEQELRKLKLDDPNILENYLKGSIDEKKLLESSDSGKISTSLTSAIFFMKAMSVIGDDPKNLQPPIQGFLSSLFNQASPTVAETLRKSSDAITQISFERTIPQFADYFIELLNYCVTMQNAQNTSGSVGNASDDLNSFFAELEKIGFKGFDPYKNIRIERHASGIDIIKNFDADKIHKVVLRTFDSPKYEEGWIRYKKDQLKTVLRIHAEKYANQQDSWIARLFKTNLAVKSPNLLTQILSLPSKLGQFPAAEGLMTIFFSGIEAFVEGKGVISAQTSINEITSTGYLSNIIITSAVKQLIVKNKWKENLPLLQEAYLYLQPDEKEQIEKHLAAVFDSNEFIVKKQEMENSKSILKGRKDKIEELQKKENDLDNLLNKLSNTLNDPLLTTSSYGLISSTIEKIKREKELLQFNRTKALVLLMIEDFFKTSDYTQYLPDDLKKACIKFIAEAMKLLTCQELVKHWIFSLMDLLIDELEETTKRTQSQAASHPKVQDSQKSLIDFIHPQQKDQILDSLCSLMNTAVNDVGWTSWALTGAVNIAMSYQYTRDKLWDSIVKQKAKFEYTPSQLNDKIMNSIGDFGKKPEGLSSSLIDWLTEHLADPR